MMVHILKKNPNGRDHESLCSVEMSSIVTGIYVIENVYYHIVGEPMVTIIKDTVRFVTLIVEPF